MAMVDAEGRVFGRWNVVDAAVVVFVLGLIPLLYGAAMLFREPVPALRSVEPAVLPAGPNGRVTIKGENFRPYMRVSFGANQGANFKFKSVNEAEIDLHEMAPGVYDVVLYDVAQEQSRLPKAFTILPSPLPAMRVTLVGVFGNLDAERAKTLKVGDVIDGVGTIRALGEPMPAQLRVNSNGLTVDIPVDKAFMLPAEVESPCDVGNQTGAPYCIANTTSLQASVLMMGRHGSGALPFQIDQVRSLAPLEHVEVVATLIAVPTVIAQIRKGDVDFGAFTNPLATGATVIEVANTRRYNDELLQADVKLDLKAERGPNGWLYIGVPLRAGADFSLRTARYQASGRVLSIRPEWTPPK
ncbi:MAG: IPT/TIG domain-containing protein [Vicinamibacterales bacterium]